MHAPHSHLPHLHKPSKAKTSAEAAAAVVLLEYITKWGATKWAPAAVARGSVDAAAQHEAAKSLLQLMTHLSHHRSVCRRGEVRYVWRVRVLTRVRVCQPDTHSHTATPTHQHYPPLPHAAAGPTCKSTCPQHWSAPC
jgi:hypothetical protein